MFERVLIANRGEIVARIARTLHRLGVSPVGVRVPGDPARAALAGCELTVEIPSYLDVAAIVAAAARAGAQAIHPGYGFLSERAELALACEAAGLVWIGPPAAAIALMGDKAAARRAATAAGVPVVPGLEDVSAAAVAAFADEHGLPLIVKAAAGGGGKGMRIVSTLGELEGALEGAAREASAAFGSGALLVERYIVPARHLEVQVLADGHGAVVDLGERECTLQRRHQKVVEETPSPAVSEGLRAVLAGEAVGLARACGYRGAGTVEFVADARDPERHYFLEMNTRLQVEHAVTEAVFGVDLVEWQLRVAAGERLALPPPRGGHAIEARIYAEDPARGFLPAAGVLRALELPDGPQLRVDCAVAGGEAVGTRYDPMIAKLVAHAPTRAAALERLRGALRASTVLGVRSNVGFLAELLADPRVRAGELDTELVAAAAAARAGADAREDARAALAALVAQWDALDGADDTFARLRGWRIAAPAPPVMHALVLDGERPVEVGLAAGGAALVGGEPAAVELVSGAALAGGGRRLRIALDGVAEEWVLAREGDAWWVGHAGRAWRVAPDPRAGGGEEGVAGDELRAPMPGAIVDVRAREGAVVARGEVVLVMESMKMELQITAPRDGTLASLRVAAGDQVALDALLATLAERAA